MSTEVVDGDKMSGPLGARYELLDRVSAAQTPRLTSWRANDLLLRRQVRLDVHRPGGEAAGAFVTAALRAGAANHPTLARVLDVVDEGHQAYVVSAWVEGTPLSSVLAEGPLEPAAAVAIIRQLAEGVAAAHRAETTVGVLRPDNVVLTPGDTVTVARVPVPGPTPFDDLRALGALLYATLTARWPLDAGSGGLPPAPTTGGRLCTPRQLRAGVPANLSALTMHALFPERAGGITSAEAFIGALDAPDTRTDLLPFGIRNVVTAPRDRTKRRLRIGVPLLAVVALGLVAGVIAALITALPHLSGGGKAHSTLAVAAGQGGGHSASSSPSASKSASPKPTHQAPPRPLHVARVTSYNPYLQPPGDDNAAEVGRTADGNPHDAWQTDPYFRKPDFGGLKPGVGLMYDLGGSTAVRQVRITTPTPGLNLEIRAGDSPGAPLSSYRAVATRAHVPSSFTIQLPGSTHARYWLVWITSLVGQANGDYQGAIGEVTFLG